jgi:NADH-quinone oxidoreductase subunit G
VLPASGTQERAGSYTNWEGRTQRFAKAVDAPDLVQDDWEIVVQLAALLGRDLGFHDLEGIRAEVAELGLRASRTRCPRPSPSDGRRQDEARRGGGGPRGPAPAAAARGRHDAGRRGRPVRHPAAPRPSCSTRPTPRPPASPTATRSSCRGGDPLRLPAEVRHDVVPGVVVVPTLVGDRSTAPLAGADGTGRVTVAAADVEVGA